MVVVVKDKNENKDSLFRRFVKHFLEDNIAEEFKKKLFYKKPSLLRKEKNEKWKYYKKLRRKLKNQ